MGFGLGEGRVAGGRDVGGVMGGGEGRVEVAGGSSVMDSAWS